MTKKTERRLLLYKRKGINRKVEGKGTGGKGAGYEQTYATETKREEVMGRENDQSILYACLTLPKWRTLLCITNKKRKKH